MRKGLMVIGIALVLFAGLFAFELEQGLDRASQGCGRIPCTVTVDGGYGWEIFSTILSGGFLLIGLAAALKPRNALHQPNCSAAP
jgi:hypothetical protein